MQWHLAILIFKSNVTLKWQVNSSYQTHLVCVLHSVFNDKKLYHFVSSVKKPRESCLIHGSSWWANCCTNLPHAILDDKKLYHFVKVSWLYNDNVKKCFKSVPSQLPIGFLLTKFNHYSLIDSASQNMLITLLQ